MLDVSTMANCLAHGKRDRNFPAVVIRLLLDMYTRQRMYTNWSGARSDFFHTDNGVKQGGILSPILFCVWVAVNELLKRLNDSGLGCHIGHLSYVWLRRRPDDVSVVSPSVRALQQMLDICDLFAGEYKVILYTWHSWAIWLVHLYHVTVPKKTILDGSLWRWPRSGSVKSSCGKIAQSKVSHLYKGATVANLGR